MLKYALLALALYVCLVSCRDEVCKDLSPTKLFADPKNPHIYHHCSYGRDVGVVTCTDNEVFDEHQQTCIEPIHSDKECTSPNGKFDYPGNPHKFIVCYQGHAYIFECPADTVWSESLKICQNNVEGKTWAP